MCAGPQGEGHSRWHHADPASVNYRRAKYPQSCNGSMNKPVPAAAPTATTKRESNKLKIIRQYHI